MYKEGKEMKKLKTILILTLTLAMTFATTVFVGADTTTDLSTMKVYAVDASGNKTEVSMDFNSTTYTYDLTVLSDTVSISIEAEPADSTSTWSVEKDGINTIMDFGTNLTIVDVTSSTGAVGKYTLNTTKLTAEEESTYQSDAVSTDGGNDNKSADKTVMVGEQEFTISSSFSKSDIPQGFKKSSAEYDGEKYTCIKGEVKDLTAFYLVNDETKDFYIYDADSNSFYLMDNIEIKSRMYTIVNPAETDELLENYEQKTVTMIDREVEAWVLDEEEGMYLVYAMNWNGDTSLYCYDDNEKCFQRYLVSEDANTQAEAANKAYENLQTKYNNLVDKYNVMLKILCGLVIVIIILIFVIINLSIHKKAKKIKSGSDKKEKDTDKYDSEDDATSEKSEEIKETGEVAEIEELVEDEFDEAEIPETEIAQETEEVLETEIPEPVIDNDMSDRTYGDEPTFGTDKQQEEGFYGGEIEEEDEILIDLTEDEIVAEVENEPVVETQEKTVVETEEEPVEEETEQPAGVTEEEIEKNLEVAQQESEEDLKETLKSMLPDEQDAEDDDDDFEFIDLN
jgi:hypothetical protein